MHKCTLHWFFLHSWPLLHFYLKTIGMLRYQSTIKIVDIMIWGIIKKIIQIQ